MGVGLGTAVGGLDGTTVVGGNVVDGSAVGTAVGPAVGNAVGPDVGIVVGTYI